VKILCTAVVAVFAMGAVVAGGALADSNDLQFSQTQGADGLFHVDMTVSYVFPGLPPRTANSGVGTVRITMPGGDLKLDSVDPAYTCFASGETATCSADGQPQGDGLAFPGTMSLHLVSTRCWSGAGSADIWAAPNDPGTAPDVSLPFQSGDCLVDTPQQPVLAGHAPKCKVPKLTNVPLASATRRLTNAHCARGVVTYKKSSRVNRGRVISQSVKPGKLLKERAKVNLVVAR
jgi:hypothetical protein